jgi:biotin transport system substrate-specific component
MGKIFSPQGAVMLAIRSNDTFPLRQILTVIIGVCVMILGSKLKVPMTPVPFTFQTVGVLLIALTCSPAKAFLSVLVWISLGACGFSVFAGNAGMIMGPTAGYFGGMLVAVTLMSACQCYIAPFFNRLFSKKESEEFLTVPASILVGCLGSMIILSLGWLNLSQYIGSVQAWHLGVAPFLFLELCKVIGVAMAVDTLQWQKIGR